MNFKILLLKILMFLDFLICRSRLFHSFIVEGEKEFLKNSCFVWSCWIFSEFPEKYLVFGEGTSWKRDLGDWLLIIINKQQRCFDEMKFFMLNHKLCLHNTISLSRHEQEATFREILLPLSGNINDRKFC